MGTWKLDKGNQALESVRAEWLALQSVCPGSPFQTYEWQDAWYRNYRHQPVIWTFRECKDLVGLAALTTQRAPFNALRFAGMGPSDILSVVAHPEHTHSVHVAFGEMLAQHQGLVDLHQVSSDSELSAALGDGNRKKQATRLLLQLPATYDAYLQTLSKSLRTDCKRLAKKPFTSGEARIIRVQPPEVENALKQVFSTHQARWKGKGISLAFLAKQQRFHLDWGRQGSQYLDLRLLEFEGKIVGAYYGMRFGRTAYFYQSGFDPTCKAISPGTLLVGDAIRSAIEDGLTHFDFMRGDEPYKRRWKPQVELSNYRYIIGNNILGAVGRRFNLAGLSLENKLRAKLEGHRQPGAEVPAGNPPTSSPVELK